MWIFWVLLVLWVFWFPSSIKISFTCDLSLDSVVTKCTCTNMMFRKHGFNYEQQINSLSQMQVCNVLIFYTGITTSSKAQTLRWFPSVLVRVLDQNWWDEYLWRGLLEWLIGCGPANPTKAVYQWKEQESNSCSVHQAECLSWLSIRSGMPKK